MSKEGIPALITKETIKKQIKKNSEENEVIIGDIEKEAIKDVLKEFNLLYPNGLNNYKTIHRLRIWSDKSIENVINKYPELKDKINIIKNDVCNELGYIFYKDKFNDLSILIKNKKVTRINPEWIRENDYGFFQTLTKTFRSNDGSIDWNFIKKHLNILDTQWSYEDQTPITIEVITQRILEKLEELKPEKFNSNWIKYNVLGDAEHILKRSANGALDENLNWGQIINKLPEKWKGRWTFQEQKDYSFDDCVFEMNKILEEKEPNYLNPKLLREFNRPIHRKLSKLLKDENGKICWEKFVKQLSPRWQNVWTLQEQKRDRTLEECLDDLIKKLDLDNPETFSPSWIQGNLRKIYDRLCDLLRIKEDRIDWNKLISQLPSKYKDRWIFEEQRTRTIEECTEDLLFVLEKENPREFNPYWIYKNIRPVYARLRNLLRKEKREIEWYKVINFLSPKWKERWEQQGFEGYENKEEIDLISEKYKSKFYTVVYYASLDNKNDRNIANEIVKELIFLVKKGDIKAKEKLIENLRFVCEEWISQYQDLQSYQIASSDLDHIIERCIYNYKEGEKSNFFNYLSKSLEFGQLGISKISSFEDWMRTTKEDDE